LIKPILVGGQALYYKHIFENIKYPYDARSQGIQGTVYVSFTITKEGKLKDTMLEMSIGGGCDEEALRVISSFVGEFIPGKIEGENVDVRVVSPIQFKF